MHTTRMCSHINHTTYHHFLFGFYHFSHSPEYDTSIVEMLGLIIIEWLERERMICYPYSINHTGIYKKILICIIAGGDPENLRGRWLMGWLPIVNHTGTKGVAG